uniref:Uncharacterized protein n=1 Tax=Globodera rostochiensis TaxID=31243 RepID=A0A914HZP6_GLORO
MLLLGIYQIKSSLVTQFSASSVGQHSHRENIEFTRQSRTFVAKWPLELEELLNALTPTNQFRMDAEKS